jgi:hypothetical protein
MNDDNKNETDNDEQKGGRNINSAIPFNCQELIRTTSNVQHTGFSLTVNKESPTEPPVVYIIVASNITKNN